ncbi:MAG: UPF0182 family protein [Gemmatimonadetes bacterium]|nr:UPF0182 family protein [Gemmatimonadota bacterium]
MPTSSRASFSRRFLLTLVAVFVVLLAAPALSGFITDWLWFREIGFQSIFLTSLNWRGTFFGLGALVAFGALYGNLRLARRGAERHVAMYVQLGEGLRVDATQIVPRLLEGVALLMALIMGAAFSAGWLTVLQAFHGVSVGAADPLFGRDIGYYLFTLPAVAMVLDALRTLTGMALAFVGITHVLRGTFVVAGRPISIEPSAARHLGALLALFFVLGAVRLWVVGSADLLYSNTGPLFGASYTDVHYRLPGIRLGAVAGLVAAGAVLYGVARGRLVWYTVLATIGWLGVNVTARGLVPAAVQKFVVAPNELVRETPYLQHHIDFTRRAWGLDSVETRELTGDAQLTMDGIKANAATIGNVRLWERDLLKQTFSQLQEIRTYYDFGSVHDDRYVIDGKYRQVHLSARELNTAALPTRTFINERLTFTHGLGLTMAPVNEVTNEGLPVLFVKDVPPVSTVGIKVTRPQIYYGELTNSYVFVGTGQKEFDYPAGEANVYTPYAGKGGVPVGSFLRRLLFAWDFGSLKILLSDDIAGGARVLYRRNILARAETALPFVRFDEEPYLVVNDAGELKWMLDAYTTSRVYPYAQRIEGGVNYMRNSVKVVIDAYDGTVDAYVADAADPVIRTFARIFPNILKPLDAMPADLRRHVRYPSALFRAQTSLHATYHMVQPETFYHKEDQWQFPAVADKERASSGFMRHIILRLPGEASEEFIYMMPFTPRGKDNMAAWMVARMDGAHYGKLVVYRFPKQSLVYGPTQIANRINQDTEISRQITLWDQRGSQVIRGELLVIPIGESLIYVQPVYLRAQGGSIPELKRVVVAYENQVVMDETLERGLAQLFGGSASAIAAAGAASTVDAAGTASRAASVVGAAGSANPAIAALVREAAQLYERATAAQRAGDWAEYGRQIERLGAVLRDLKAKAP